MVGRGRGSGGAEWDAMGRVWGRRGRDGGKAVGPGKAEKKSTSAKCSLILLWSSWVSVCLGMYPHVVSLSAFDSAAIFRSSRVGLVNCNLWSSASGARRQTIVVQSRMTVDSSSSALNKARSEKGLHTSTCGDAWSLRSERAEYIILGLYSAPSLALELTPLTALLTLSLLPIQLFQLSRERTSSNTLSLSQPYPPEQSQK